MTELATTQQRLWQLFTAPSGVGAALADAGDADGRTLEGFVVSDPRAPATLRLEIYANAYFQRIHDVLAEDFGALSAALGEAGFHDLVTVYLCVHPSTHPSLRHVGRSLPGFLADGGAAAPFRRRWPWAADLARLEWALLHAFDARDIVPLDVDVLARIAPERWETLRFAILPHVRQLDLTWDAVALREAFERDEPLALPGEPHATGALVWRQREGVRFRRIDGEESELLARIDAGATFGALCARLADRVGDGDAAARAASWLRSWVDAGLLVLA